MDMSVYMEMCHVMLIWHFLYMLSFYPYMVSLILFFFSINQLQLENNQIVDKGYAEVIVGADEVAVAASPSGVAHALVNVDPIRSTFFLGCQDSMINYNSSATDFSVWKDL